MNTNTTATVTPAKATTKGSLRTAAGPKASGQPAVSFAPHDNPSNAEPPDSKKAPGTSASALKKRTDKLGANIVELIESQKPPTITTYISTLAMEMLAANAHFQDRAATAKRFDIFTTPTDAKTWLPSNIKKIKIGLKASQYDDDDEYQNIAACCKDLVEEFKTKLNYQYHRLAAMEERCAQTKRLKTFITEAYGLFQAYTKYYAEITEMGTLSRPLDTAAALFLKRFMTGYLKTENFFKYYLDVDLQVAIDALTAHVPSMKDPDTLLTQAEPNPVTTGNEDMDEAAKKRRNAYGYTPDEDAIYKRIKEDAKKYFLQVTMGIQETIDSVRNDAIYDASLHAWKISKQTEAATEACAAAVALVPTITPETMNALIEKKTTAVLEKNARKVAAKAIDKHIAQKFGKVKNVLGGGKAKSTQPKHNNGTKRKGGLNSTQQPGPKRKRRKTEQQQQAQKEPPKQRPQPRTSNKQGRNGKGNRGGRPNAGRHGSQTKRR